MEIKLNKHILQSFLVTMHTNELNELIIKMDEFGRLGCEFNRNEKTLQTVKELIH